MFVFFVISKTVKILVLIQVVICLGISGHALSQPNNSGQDDYLYARRLFDEGYFDLAAEQLERVLSDNPGMVNADEAQFLLGESLMLDGKAKGARAAFLRVVIVFPESPRAPEAMLNIGIALEKMGQFPEAVQAYRRVYSFYPQSSLTTESLRRALLISTRTDDNAEAEIIGDLLIEKYPFSEAADQARLLKASWQIELGNQLIARSYLERIAERTLLDSLASKAYLMLGMLFKNNWELDSADKAFRKAMQRDSISTAAQEARLELAKLLNYRGLPDQTFQILQPLIKSQLGDVTHQAIMRVGDASYRKGDLSESYQVYSKSTLPEAVIKTAWVAERLGYSQKALDKYLEISKSALPESKTAKLRAAQLASSLSQNFLAEQLWSDISNDSTLIDPFGQSIYELAKTKLTNLNSISYEEISELAVKLAKYFPQSPFLDDILYLQAIAAENLKKHDDAKNICESLVSLYPASSLSDSALVMIDFLNRCRLRGDKLMERMAELSSTPMMTQNQASWSLDWGDFYLNDFKDPVKAIDQYDIVLERPGITKEQMLHALQNSCDAYLRLYQIALREQDSVAIEMYRYNTYARLQSLLLEDPESGMTLHLIGAISIADLSVLDEHTATLSTLSRSADELLNLKNRSLISSFFLAQFVRTITNRSLSDSATVADWLVLADIVLQTAKDRRDIAAIKWFQAWAWNTLFPNTNSSDSTYKKLDSLRIVPEIVVKELFSEFPNTPAGFDAAWWLVEESKLKPVEKLQYLEIIERDFFYLLDPSEIAQTRGHLLDSLGQHLEAINARILADKLANWGRPNLDILSIPSSEDRYRRAWANLKSDSLYLSALEYRILLNTEPDGEFAAPALLDMASILATQDLTEVAVLYLDTLLTNFPYSTAAAKAEYIRPILELELDRYVEAYNGFKSLRSQSQNSDSSFFYDTQKVICLYRQNLLEKARKAAKELYGSYKEREDLNDAKAIFYLEKGRSLDRTKQFETARKQYKTVVDEYYLTTYADDAAFAIGLSLVAQNNFEEGIVSLIRFLENYPKSDLLADAKLSLGMAYVRSEKYSEGISILKQVWENDDSIHLWVPIFKTLISLYRKMHFFDAALKLNREYIERFPNAGDIFDRRMEIGQLYLQIGEWDESVRHYRPLLQLADAEREAEIQYYIGEACFNKGDFRTAILEYIKVPVLGRKTKLDWGVTALYQAAACYEKLGEPDGAIRMYRQIISETGATSNYGRAAQEKLDMIQAESNEK